MPYHRLARSRGAALSSCAKIWTRRLTPPASSVARARVAVVGSGRMGKIRASLVDANPRLELVAIVDTDASRGGSLASRHQVHHCDTVDTLLSNEKRNLHGLIVSTPTSSHADVIKTAADHRVSIFVEKPVDATAAKIRQAFAYCDIAGVDLCCGYQRRFDPSYVKVTELVHNGSLGKPVMANLFFADHPAPPRDFLLHGGNIFMDLSAHDIDYIVHTLQDRVVSVYATAMSSDKELAAAGVQDHATVILTFSQGTVATLFMSRSANYGYDQRCEIFGSNGSLASVQNIPEHSVSFSDRSGVHQARLQNSFPERFHEAFGLELDAFADVLLEGKAWPISGAQCYEVQRIADAAQQSFEIGDICRLD